ncbi:STAS domain-containing protein [Streptomyces spectabilis]|uniref:Anti-sigma factor antagonist n=1 Tax=Streptomyces spectabilis TaxID=68270 RepID=A0A516R1D0_STRST|nr:STAS domain-containing protein [Streptomyces spectabilis]QDQ09461.1 STAS domain-containing protein [Streptomyces spectabilis]
MTPGFPPSTRHIRAYRTQGHTVLEFHGEIDIAAALEIAPHLDRATGPREALVVIDLTPTTFIDCSGLGLLCRARTRVVERHGQLLLVCPHPRTLALLRIVRLCGVLRPYPTLCAALADAVPAKRRAKRRPRWAEGLLACHRSRTRAPS